MTPLQSFRVAIAKKSDKDIEELMLYELSPFPLGIFNEGGMRKGQKFSLYDALPKDDQSAPDLTQRINIIGGFLLHRVKWNVGTKVSSICDQYIDYVHKHYGNNCMVVFDG